MNIIKNIILSTILLIPLWGAEKHGVSPGFGTGTQYYVTGEEGEPRNVTVLTKGGITYTYVRNNANEAVLRRQENGQPIKDLYKFGANQTISWGTLTDTYFVDVLEGNGKIVVLMLLQQSYFYLEIVQNYTNAAPPAGDAYLPDDPELLALPWKPLKYGVFNPSDINISGFHNNIAALQSIRIESGDIIKLVFKNNLTASYQVVGNEIKLNGVKHQDLSFGREQILESTFFANYATMSDEDLRGIALSYVENGQLNTEITTMLNALQDATKAQALITRIESLFDE